jgi:hypothetical protein
MEITPDIVGPESVVQMKEMLHVLSTTGHACAILGGLAAVCYGSIRRITDIDIVVKSSAQFIDDLGLRMNGREVEPGRVVVGNVELIAPPLRLKGEGGPYFWQWTQGVSDGIHCETVAGEDVPFISAEDLLLIKLILARGEERKKFDLFDATNMINNGEISLRWGYFWQRTGETAATDRVIASLKKLDKYNSIPKS